MSKHILDGDHYISNNADIITSKEDVDEFVRSRKIIEKINNYSFGKSGLICGGIKEHIIIFLNINHSVA